MADDTLPDVKISEEQEELILNWLYDEIENARLARTSVVAKWEEIDRWYDLQELAEKKDYPFEGAAHLMIGVMPTFCELIKSKIMNTIWAPSDPFTVAHYDARLADFIKPVRRFMTWAVNNEVDLREVMDTLVLEYLKKGTGVTKTIYEQEWESRFEFQPEEEGSDEGSWLEIPEKVKDQPKTIHIQNADFFYQAHARDVDESEWKAHRFRLSKHELEARERSGKFKDVSRILAWEENQKTEHERETDNDDMDPHPVMMTEYEIYEVWFRHPLQPGGNPVKMQWFIHLDSRTALRKRHNWYPMQWDPFDLIVYEKREHKVYGRGVGHIALPYQKEISTMHNQRLDSVTVRNAPVFKKKADSLLPDFISFRPGGTIPVNEMDEIETLFTGQQFDSTISDEQHTLGMLRERLGIEDFSQDMNIGQSTSVLAVMAERNRRFDNTIQRWRRFLSKVMTKVMMLYQKYYPEGKAFRILGEDGQYVEMTMQFPEIMLAKGMGIDVTATTASTSKELDRQNKLSLFSLITQYYGQLTQYVLQSQSPQLPEPVRMAMLQIVNALSTFVEDILEDFNLTHAREIAGVIESARQAAIGAGQQPVQPQVGPGDTGVGAVSGAPAGDQGATGGAASQGY